MKTTTKTVVHHILHAIMMLVMMGWCGAAWADDSSSAATDMVIYHTDFQDWDYSSPVTPAKSIVKETVDGQAFTLSLYDVLVDPTGQNSSKFSADVIDLGYARAEKATEATKAYIETSVLKNVSTIEFVQATTGGTGKRGWGVQVKGPNDTAWRNAYTTPIQSASGELVRFSINEDNVQLRFYNVYPTENAYMMSLTIKGKVVPANQAKVSYYDTDGKTLIGEQTLTKASADDKLSLTYQYGADAVTVGTGMVFRGWYDGTGDAAAKVAEGTEIFKDCRLYAKATAKEEALSGNEYTYDFTKSYWSPDEHDLISITDGKYVNQHGWRIEQYGTIKIDVAEEAQITLTACSKGGAGTVTDSDGNQVASFAYSKTDNETIVISYDGEQPTTLTFTMSTPSYIHSIDVLNINPIYVSFNFPNKKIEGKVPETLRGDKDNMVTLPGNYGFYRKGWTFTGWTDGTTLYEAGKRYAFDHDITLTPKMSQNTVDITDINTPVDVVWPFDHTKAPALNLSNSTEPSTIYTSRASVEGEPHDMDLRINATKGMLVNTDKTMNDLTDGTAGAKEAEGAQVSDGLRFTVPAVFGMKVKIHASDKKDQKTSTSFGEGDNYAKIALNKADSLCTKMEVADNGKTMLLTYTGDDTSLELIVDKAGNAQDATYGFLKDITVTYPVLPNVVAENVLETVDKQNFPNEKAENAGNVEIVITTTYSNTGSRLKVGDVATVNAVPEYGYTVKGFRVKGSSTYLSMKSSTDATTGETVASADYTVTDGVTTIEVVFAHLALHKLTAKIANTGKATVSMSPSYENLTKDVYDSQGNLTQREAWFTAGTSVTAFAEPGAGYIVAYWTEGASDEQKATGSNSYTFNMGETDNSISLHLKDGVEGSVVFDSSVANVNGETPAFKGAGSMPIDQISNVMSFTIPTNYTLYKNVDDDNNTIAEGYTLKYWTDRQGNRYELGNTYSFSDENMSLTLTPVFEKNPTTAENRLSDAVVRYDFGSKAHYYDDPITKTRRRVYAQTVDIGNNSKVFWTTKSEVKVLQNGLVSSHTRDVALWCDTGNRGYIRNTDIDDWGSFGPGTTFWCPAGMGTKVSILSYSKMSTTTIDGVVPTLDRARTNEERLNAGVSTLEEEENGGKKGNIYVYSYTTNNTATRLPVVIGDDYSYYQWMEVTIKAANMVNLHVDVDNDQHGAVGDISASSDYGITELEDGGYAIQKGDRVKLRFERFFGYELDKITNKLLTDADGNPVNVLTMKADGSVDMLGRHDESLTINVKPNADGSWGTPSGENMTRFVLRKIEPSDEEAEAGQRTVYELEFDITDHRTLNICFKEKPTYYITYNAGEFASGVPPTAHWVEVGEEYVIPQNTGLYYEGNTLDHWEDNNGNVYAIDSKHKAEAEDLRLVPVFKRNTFSILDITEPQTVAWKLSTKDGAQEMNIEKVPGILVAQLYKGEEKIDLKMDLTGTPDGEKIENKFDNMSNSEYMQVKAKSIIGFPSTPGCKVKVTATADPSSLTVADKKAGADGYTVGKKLIEVTCSGDTAVQNAVFSAPLSLYTFDVTYQPQKDLKKPTVSSLSCDGTTYTAAEISNMMAADGCVTFNVSPATDKGGNEVIPDITGTATENGKVATTTEATVYTLKTDVTVKTATGFIVETYPIEFKLKEPADNPQLVSITVNGDKFTEKTTVLNEVARSGVIKLEFNRTMQAATIQIGDSTYTAESGKTLSFRYWDLQAGATVPITVNANSFADIYNKRFADELSLTLHVTDEKDKYHHHNFDFVVGIDGTIDDAIKAANNNTNGAHRYYIFIPDGEYQLTGNDPVNIRVNETTLTNFNNGVTKISKPNISIIGQSKEGTTVYNLPTYEGSSSTATINIDRNTSDFYAQDLTLENRFDYWGTSGGAGRAVAFWDRGNRSILKNVALLSWQDTYYSNNARDFRSYLENCDIAGVVDFICGDGDIWFEKCNILLRDRGGNNITAPSTQVEQKWGYVFDNCNIKTEIDNPQLLKENDWALGRPWSGSPACTWLNTRMYTQPRAVGWTKMDVDRVLRFHEFRSMDANGELLSLGRRSLAASSPAPGSDDCVLSDDEAKKYTLRNVTGGDDAFEPNVQCRQIDAASANEADKDANSMTWDDGIAVDDDNMSWNLFEPALCYFVFKYNENTGKWNYITNTTDNSLKLTSYGSGTYCVRAANQHGGLGAPTASVRYAMQSPYKLTIKQTGDLTVDGVPYGWSTICLPFNARVPEGVITYAATAHNSDDPDEKVTDFEMTLSPVEFIDSNKGYVVYGPAGDHNFNPTSHSCDKPTILEGNATNAAISAENVSCYVLANKSWGLGFYKYTGSTLAAYRAWLPDHMVDDMLNEILVSGTRGIRLVIDNGTSAISVPTCDADNADNEMYDLSGRRINTPSRQSIYIVRGKGKYINK